MKAMAFLGSGDYAPGRQLGQRTSNLVQLGGHL